MQYIKLIQSKVRFLFSYFNFLLLYKSSLHSIIFMSDLSKSNISVLFTLLSKILIKLILIDGYPLNFLYFHLLFTYRHTNLQFYAFFYLCPKACYFIFTIYRFKKCHSYFFNIQTLESLFSMSFMSNQETGV